MSDWLRRALDGRRRVRSLVQSEASECGLACLAMVANYHRHAIDLSYLRALFPLSRAGMSLADIVAVADALDLDAGGYALGNVGELDGVALPAILHWNGNHFVVLEAIKRGRYRVHDPEFGLRIYDRADMERMFSGVVLEFAPRVDFQRLRAERKLGFVEIFHTTRGLAGTVWQIALVSIAIALLSLAMPVLLQLSLDVVIPQVDLDLLHVLALGLLLMMLFEAVGRWLRDTITLRASTLLQLQFTRNVVGHAFRLPLSYFELRHPGDFVARTDSIDHIKGFLVGGLVTALADTATSVLLVGLMLYYSPLMAAVTLLTLVAVLALRVLTFPRLNRATAGSLEARSEERARLLDGLRRVDSLKAHNGAELFALRWFESFSRFANLDFRARKAGIDAELFMHAVIAASTVATLYLGITGVIGNALTIGTLYAFFALRGDFFERVNALTTNLLHLSAMRVHFQRLDDVVGHAEEPGLHDARIHRPIRKSVQLADVTIRFGQGEAPILTDANLAVDVAGAESVAIVGASGSGKSSLLKILASLHEPAAGALAIDGMPLDRFGKREFRANLGVVFADDGLFAGTVADNLALFDPGVSRAEMEAALARVGLVEEIERLPQGYATQVSEESGLLSTGQRRRLLIARALCRRPRLLLLDEVTANLDPVTEAALVDSLQGVKAAKVFVTHSERLLDRVDRVLRIADGRLTEERRAPPATPAARVPESA
ncbi:peptidase domain-containing ABC transporter [Methylobacterium sp. NEAU 140]|uniref:peptidase domain-containing ABC transporter n=1 Tax=Methylobacterium sp. NEAU 140 TaxID=3064945 RepID=UPI002734C947|nr:peptidase domain-containing ABC transporter [Methylobacterium sp. NEAU 140]MDP4026557.1 peptidase domain-containing ABC transporter [Methylobacterium sp. NEAU 140]